MTDYADRRAVTRRQDKELAATLNELGVDLTPSAEWRVVIALLRGAWPGELTQSQELAYLTILNDLPERDVANAVKDLARKGQQYRPTPPEILTQLNATGTSDLDDPAPPFDEAWHLITRAGATTGYDAKRAQQHLTAQCPPVATWTAQRTLTRLWREPVDCPQNGRFVRRDLQASYDQHAKVWENPERRLGLTQRTANGLQQLDAATIVNRLGQ